MSVPRKDEIVFICAISSRVVRYAILGFFTPGKTPGARANGAATWVQARQELHKLLIQSAPCLRVGKAQNPVPVYAGPYQAFNFVDRNMAWQIL